MEVLDRMEMKKCETCGELYSSTYRTCPFCQEEEAMRRGKPMHRRASDFRNRRGHHTAGVLLLVVCLVIVGGGAMWLFRDNLAGLLGIRETIGSGDEGISSSVDPDAGSTSDNYEDPYDPNYNVDATAPETSVTISETQLSLSAGGTAQLSAGEGSGTYTWSSSNPEIATVDESGAVTAVAGGAVTITVSDGYTTAQCAVQVAGTAGTGLTINREDFTQGVGESWTLEIEGTSSPVTWSIEDSSIATIDANGTVTGVSSGMTTAYGTVDGQTLECIVRIR